MTISRIPRALAIGLTASALSGLGGGAAHAALLYDQNVTPDVIFGSGNSNGSYTVDRHSGVELGLRGKLRFDSNNLPANTYNSNGDGTYSFSAGTPNLVGPNLPGWATTTTPVWSFEWSINSRYDNIGSLNLDGLTYELGIDFDPSSGTNFLTFDPINVSFWDHSFGDNSTLNGAGLEAGDPGTYATYIADYNVAQNSWNYEFFNSGPYAGFDPNTDGTYTIYLTASDGDTVLASTSIDIIVGSGVPAAVPLPGALALFASGLGVLGFAGRKRAKAGAETAA